MLQRGNPVSEDSISDEDVAELHNDQLANFPNSVLSLQEDAANKIELPLPVRLDLLKGRICNQNSSSSFEKPLEDDEVEMPDFKDGDLHDVLGDVVADSSDEENVSEDEKPLEDDEVEMPDFKDGDLHDVLGEVVADSSDEENVSEDEVSTVLSTRHLHKNGHPFIRNDQVKDTNRKSEALLCFKESASCSASRATCPMANTSGTTPKKIIIYGIWSKAKPRLPFPSVSHKNGHNNHSISNIDRLPKIMEAVDSRAFASLDGNHLEDDDIMEVKSSTEPAETEALPREFNHPSMADLFNELQDKTDLHPHDGQRKRKTVQLFQKNSRSHLQDIVVDSEDSPEPVNSGSSSDNEVSDHHMKITFLGKKMQTMADRFQEALGSSSVITEGSNVGAVNKLGTGIFGKLQQVMQKEKERDMDFWKKLQAGARPDSELGCVDVEIISRYLDGKLTVCQCLFGMYSENFPLEGEGMDFGGSKSGKRTIIFSPRVCDNVDLEVGSLIRIHPPWKEVQVGNDNIILCTYFSERP